MKSNYKRLRPYIQAVDVRNKENRKDNLLGVSTQKKFIKSVANTVGTNFKRYKVVKKFQFTYVPDTSRRGDKIGIAMLEDIEQAIVSQAYTVFEVIDQEKLLPEYLMMWFRRPEFDRYARYKSHGSVREIFDWDEMCETEIPVHDIEKQKAIVKEYNTIVNRIKLNEKLNKKLEETAQAIYQEWFVDFEFPYDFAQGKSDVNSKPYKSSGGKMIWNDELGREIPEGWKVGVLEEIMTFKNGKKKPNSEGAIPVYGGNGILGYVDEYSNEDILAIGRVGAYCGSLFRVLGKCWVSDNAISAKSRNNFNMFCFYTLKVLNLNERSEGTGQPLLTQGILNAIGSIIPNKNIISNYENITKILFGRINEHNKEIESLKNIHNTILSKMSKG